MDATAGGWRFAVSTGALRPTCAGKRKAAVNRHPLTVCHRNRLRLALPAHRCLLLSSRHPPHVAWCAEVRTEQGHGQFVSRQPRGAVNRALSRWKEITAPRKVERTGIPATGV